jgi:hypothetical protein
MPAPPPLHSSPPAFPQTVRAFQLRSRPAPRAWGLHAAGASVPRKTHPRAGRPRAPHSNRSGATPPPRVCCSVCKIGPQLGLTPPKSRLGDPSSPRPAAFSAQLIQHAGPIYFGGNKPSGPRAAGPPRLGKNDRGGADRHRDRKGAVIRTRSASEGCRRGCPSAFAARRGARGRWGRSGMFVGHPRASPANGRRAAGIAVGPGRRSQPSTIGHVVRMRNAPKVNSRGSRRDP